MAFWTARTVTGSADRLSAKLMLFNCDDILSRTSTGAMTSITSRICLMTNWQATMSETSSWSSERAWSWESPLNERFSILPAGTVKNKSHSPLVTFTASAAEGATKIGVGRNIFRKA